MIEEREDRLSADEQPKPKPKPDPATLAYLESLPWQPFGQEW